MKAVHALAITIIATILTACLLRVSFVQRDDARRADAQYQDALARVDKLQRQELATLELLNTQVDREHDLEVLTERALKALMESQLLASQQSETLFRSFLALRAQVIAKELSDRQQPPIEKRVDDILLSVAKPKENRP